MPLCRPKRILETLKYVCTVGTVRSLFRILLVHECCVIKLAFTAADNSAFSMGPCTIDYKEQERDLSYFPVLII